MNKDYINGKLCGMLQMVINSWSSYNQTTMLRESQIRQMRAVLNEVEELYEEEQE